MRSTRESTTRQDPIWLNKAVYEPKRQRTFEVVKRAVDTLMEQRKHDGTTRISLNTIVTTAKQQDPTGRGIAHTAILENEEAYAYYKKFRTANTPKKHQPAPKKGQSQLIIKTDRDQARIRQRYLKSSREDLVEQLLSVEQQYAELHERYLVTNDKLLAWQLRAEQAETLLNTRQEQRGQEAGKVSSPTQRRRPKTECTTGPLPKHLVPLLAFAGPHNVAENKVQAHVDMGLLPVKRGEWMDTDGTIVTLALDAHIPQFD